MEQIGYVVQLEEDQAIVDVRRVTACGDKCSSCGGECHVQGVRVKMKNTLHAKPGDYIEVSSETKTIMKAAFLVYIIPLVSLVLGIGIGISAFNNIGIKDNEFYSFLIGMVFLGISYLCIKKIDSRLREKGVEHFYMSNVL